MSPAMQFVTESAVQTIGQETRPFVAESTQQDADIETVPHPDDISPQAAAAAAAAAPTAADRDAGRTSMETIQFYLNNFHRFRHRCGRSQRFRQRCCRSHWFRQRCCRSLILFIGHTVAYTSNAKSVYYAVNIHRADIVLFRGFERGSPAHRSCRRPIEEMAWSMSGLGVYGV